MPERGRGGMVEALRGVPQDLSLYASRDDHKDETKDAQGYAQSVPPLSLVRESAITSQRILAFSAFHSIYSQSVPCACGHRWEFETDVRGLWYRMLGSVVRQLDNNTDAGRGWGWHWTLYRLEIY